MENADPRSFEFVLGKISDGAIFEGFACQFLEQVLGYNFMPAGGLKDRGIDGLEHIYHREGYDRYIYQISIEKAYKGKLERTLETLEKNGVKFDRLFFVTNKEVRDKDIIIDDLFEKYKKPVIIYDLKWFSANINHSAGTIRVYHTFICNYFHEYEQPGKAYEVTDLMGDPRLYVFLAQQWDSYHQELSLDAILADTLILYCLEETDPEKNKFKTEEEIKKGIAGYIGFDPKQLYNIITQRLQILSAKPRRITYHTKAKAYCLPYETRLKIQERNLLDIQLYENFKREVEAKLGIYLKNDGITVKNGFSLIESVIHQIFYQQGIEFSDFILNAKNNEIYEKNLVDIVSDAVDKSSVIPKNKEDVKMSLIITIRDLIYNGTPQQKIFLEKLSNTYMMLFLLQCDPKLCTFFNSMASQLCVYVCTSIIIPALSEYYLEDVNRSHWNLLKGASNAGVTLIINKTIINELVSHFQMIMNKYELTYKEFEDIYLSDEIQLLYIEEIMIRSYFYAKKRGNVKDFRAFIDKFISPTLINTEAELIEWLKTEFRINYISDESLGVQIDPGEESLLYEELKNQKHHYIQARTDTRLILTIYAIREKNNEASSSGIFGYRTWWLSKDILTHRAVNKVFKSKYEVSCYMRPDFLYNYISLAPTKSQIDAVYSGIFPCLLGVNISYHLPREVIETVHQYLLEHKEKNHARVAASLRSLVERLKTDPSLKTKSKVIHYLDQKLRELESTPGSVKAFSSCKNELE